MVEYSCHQLVFLQVINLSQFQEIRLILRTGFDMEEYKLSANK